MKDKIKEINIKMPGQILDYVDTKEHLLELFNYITNLQKENKNRISESLAYDLAVARVKELEYRIDKAIEHTKKEIADIEFMKKEYSDYDKISEIEVKLKSIEELNNILNGGDE